jgi:hypothetical protein
MADHPPLVRLIRWFRPPGRVLPRAGGPRILGEARAMFKNIPSRGGISHRMLTDITPTPSRARSRPIETM